MNGSLTTYQVLGLLAVVAVLVTGQVLLKIAAQHVVLNQGAFSFLRSFLNWQFIIALIVYGLGALFWVVLLKEIPLGRAYPFTALSYVLLPIAAAVLFKEPLTPRSVMGIGFLLVGLYLITSDQPGS